ncbi:hypothetical protein CASFOL_033864 [Castilleja foliolosa]|uniref:C2H2-type domain-containing protein n=1 Tax=Castilleja foliolosa TaxID=1961234 RepID=A0ABD3BY59_9LAMI
MASLPLCSNGFLRPTFKGIVGKKLSVGAVRKKSRLELCIIVGAVGKKPIGTNPDDEEEVSEEEVEQEVSEEEGILISKDPDSSSSNSGGGDDGEPKGLRPFKCNMPNCKDEHYQSPHALRNHFISNHKNVENMKGIMLYFLHCCD